MGISPLRQRMIGDMTSRRIGEKAQKNYIRCVSSLAAFIGRSPKTATAEDLRLNRIHLVESALGASSVNAYMSALRFFFGITLDRADLLKCLFHVYESPRLPTILTQEEVARLLDAAPGAKHKAALSVAYGAGPQSLRGAVAEGLRYRQRPDAAACRAGQGPQGPPSHALLDILREWYRIGRPVAWLFPNCRRIALPPGVAQLNGVVEGIIRPRGECLVHASCRVLRASAFENAGWNSNRRTALRDRFQHERAGRDPRIGPNLDIANDDGCRANKNAATYFRMPIPGSHSASPEGNAMKDRDIVFDDHRFACDEAGGVVEEYAFPELGGWVNIGPGHLGRPALQVESCVTPAVLPEPMRQPVGLNRGKAQEEKEGINLNPAVNPHASLFRSGCSTC